MDTAPVRRHCTQWDALAPPALTHIARLRAVLQIGIDPPKTVAEVASCLTALNARAESIAAGEAEPEPPPEPAPAPQPEKKASAGLRGLQDLLSSGPSLPGAKGDDDDEAAAMDDFLNGIEEGDDDGEQKAGQANGYGTVAVDLAAEAEKAKETMKALRKAQMDKPPPVAMKKNPKTGEMEKFESEALKDDLPEEEAECGDVQIPVGDDY